MHLPGTDDNSVLVRQQLVMRSSVRVGNCLLFIDEENEVATSAVDCTVGLVGVSFT